MSNEAGLRFYVGSGVSIFVDLNQPISLVKQFEDAIREAYDLGVEHAEELASPEGIPDFHVREVIDYVKVQLALGSTLADLSVEELLEEAYERIVSY